jgi:hypothetical protein
MSIIGPSGPPNTDTLSLFSNVVFGEASSVSSLSEKAERSSGVGGFEAAGLIGDDEESKIFSVGVLPSLKAPGGGLVVNRPACWLVWSLGKISNHSLRTSLVLIVSANEIETRESITLGLNGISKTTKAVICPNLRNYHVLITRLFSHECWVWYLPCLAISA